MAMLNQAAVKMRREAAQLSMKEAAKRAGFINAAKWGDLETGKDKANVTLRTLGKLAKALKCEARDLIKERSDER